MACLIKFDNRVAANIACATYNCNFHYKSSIFRLKIQKWGRLGEFLEKKGANFGF
jgi:hypothetical protein